MTEGKASIQIATISKEYKCIEISQTMRNVKVKDDGSINFSFSVSAGDRTDVISIAGNLNEAINLYSRGNVDILRAKKTSRNQPLKIVNLAQKIYWLRHLDHYLLFRGN